MPQTRANINNAPSTWQVYFAHTVLFSSVLCLVMIYNNWPESDGDSLWNYIKIPKTVGDAKKIGDLILKYKDSHYYSVFGAYFASYILLQSLCIPGSVVLSILAGYLFPFLLALLIICICSTLGASTFYIMIYKHKHHLLKLLSGGSNSRMVRFNNYVQDKIERHKANLLLCVIILRATPIFPNWTINLCSPLINLPFRPFVIGTFVGVAPLSIIHVCTGSVLNDMSTDTSLLNWGSVVKTSLVAVSILVIYYIKRIA